MTTRIERVAYDDATVRKFMAASVLFGAVGMLVGLFAFVGNMMFAGVYYSTQHLLKVRMANDALSVR